MDWRWPLPFLALAALAASCGGTKPLAAPDARDAGLFDLDGGVAPTDAAVDADAGGAAGDAGASDLSDGGPEFTYPLDHSPIRGLIGGRCMSSAPALPIGSMGTNRSSESAR